MLIPIQQAFPTTLPLAQSQMSFQIPKNTMVARYAQVCLSEPEMTLKETQAYLLTVLYLHNSLK